MAFCLKGIYPTVNWCEKKIRPNHMTPKAYHTGKGRRLDSLTATAQEHATPPTLANAFL